MRYQNGKFVRVLTVALCVALLAAGMPVQVFAAEVDGQPAVSAGGNGTYQSQIDDLSTKMKNLEQEKKNIESSIANVRDEKKQETEKRNYIDQQIKLTKDEITLLLERIELLELDINEKLEEISVKQAEIDANYALFLKRMRAMYVQDDASTLGLVLGADDLTSFLTKTDSMVRIADHDRKLIEKLTVQRKELEEAKAELDARLAQLEEDREDTESKKHTLDSQMQAANLRIQDIDQMEKEFLADLEKNKAMYTAMKKELEDIYAKIEWSKNPYIGGQMAWPVPGFYRISSEYGWRFGGADFHTGMDIAGSNGSIYGATVIAANSGTVKYTNWTYTPGKGYGIYVLLDHGGGVSTMYAHLSNISVKVGDVVKAGDPIAQVGSTGWSTGPHLHFEVRIDGKTVNPKPYVIGGQ